MLCDSYSFPLTQQNYTLVKKYNLNRKGNKTDLRAEWTFGMVYFKNIPSLTKRNR